MRETTKRKLLSWLMVFSMVASMFAGMPAKAIRDPETNGDIIYGLVAPEWIELNWELGTVYTADNGRPCPNDKFRYPIPYMDETNCSIKGNRYWFDYIATKDKDCEPVHLEADDLSVVYYGDANPWDEESHGTPLEGLVTNDPIFDKVVDFVPAKEEEGNEYKLGCYVLTYKNGADDAIFIINVDYPEIGFYSEPSHSAANLLGDDLDSTAVNNHPFFLGAANNEVYINIYNVEAPEDRDSRDANAEGDQNYYNTIDLAEDNAFEVNLWGVDEDGEGVELSGQTGGTNELEELGITITGPDELEDDPSLSNTKGTWYKLAFPETWKVEDGNGTCTVTGLDLSVKFSKTDYDWVWNNEKETYEWDEGDPYDLYLSLSANYLHPGLYAKVKEGNGFSLAGGSDKEETFYPGTCPVDGKIYPEHLQLAFYKAAMSSEDNQVTYVPITSSNKMIIERTNYWDEKEEAEINEWRTASESAYDVTVDDDYFDFVFYEEGRYRITFDEKDYIYVESWMPAIAFFADQSCETRTRILNSKVNEGKNQTVYALLWSNDINDDNSINPETVSFTLEANGESIEGEDTSAYITKVDEEGVWQLIYKINIPSSLCGGEDMTVKATAFSINGYCDYHEELPITFNAIKEIKITTPPAKTTYTAGETFDGTGMEVVMVYEDDTTEMITGYSISPARALTTDDTTVTITYQGRTTTQPITVNAAQNTNPGSDQNAGQGSEQTGSTGAAGSGQTGPTGITDTTLPPPMILTPGTTLSDTDSKADYTVTSSDSGNPTVEYTGTTDSEAKNITIPDTITINGVTYKVTSIADNAFKGNKTVTKITVGSNVTTIGKNAFSNCSKLKTVTIGKNVTSIGANAFNGCTSLTKLTLPVKTTDIGKNAFKGCKKLKTLTIKSTKLTSSTVANNAFKGLTKVTTIKVPKAKLKAYKKLFKKKGLSGKVKVKK